MRSVFLVMILILTLTLGAASGVASAQSADETAINTRIEGYFAAPGTAAAAYFTENGVRAFGTNVVVGRANIEKSMIESLASGGGGEIMFTRHATRLLSPATAIVHGAWEIPSATSPTNGHNIFTLVKEGNEWLIAANQIAPAAPAQ